MSYDIQISNIVATCHVGTPMNLTHQVLCLPGGKYDPDRFPGFSIHSKNPAIVISFFEKGNVVIVGAKKVEDILEGLYGFLPILSQRLQQPLNVHNLRIDNIVRHTNIGHRVDITRFHEEYATTTKYIPPNEDGFIGLRWTLDNNSAGGKRKGLCVVVFESGKLVLCAAVTQAHLDKVLEKIPILHQYKSDNTNTTMKQQKKVQEEEEEENKRYQLQQETMKECQQQLQHYMIRRKQIQDDGVVWS